MKRVFVAAILLALTVAVAQAQNVTVPQLVNYQGRLTDINGDPLSTANYTMEFNIYPVKTGGTALWGPLIFDNGTGTGHGNRVPVVQGHFNVFLGPVDTTNRPIATAFAQNSVTYLSVKVTTGPWQPSLTELLPRQQILSSPYALQTQNAETLGTAMWRGTGGLINQIVNSLAMSVGFNYRNTAAPANGMIVEGNVGIGTNAPGSNKLKVVGASNLDGNVIITGNVGVGFPSPTQKLEVNGRIVDKTGFLAPVGAITAFGGSAAPAGWLLCDGTAFSRATYADLFAVISTTYGAGDGSSTFNVPNLKGRVVVGFDSGQTEFNGVGKTGGAKTHTLAEAEMPAHAHTFSDTYPRDDGGNRETDPYDGGSDIRVGDGDGTWQLFRTGIWTSSRGSGTAHNNLQPFITLQYVIKY